MTMRTLLTAAVTVALAGCNAGTFTPITILNAIGADEACQGDSSVYVPRGSLNIAFASQYYGLFAAESSLPPVDLEVDGAVVSPGSGNDFVAEQMHVSYTSTPELALADVTKPVHFVIAAGATRDEQEVLAELLTPEAATAIAGALADGQQLDLVASFYFTGYYRNGTPAQTNVVNYPIQIYDVANPCAAGFKVDPDVNVCGNLGQGRMACVEEAAP